MACIVFVFALLLSPLIICTTAIASNPARGNVSLQHEDFEPAGHPGVRLLGRTNSARFSSCPSGGSDTGGTCAVLSCDAWRGNVHCLSGRCICAPGLCLSWKGECVQQGSLGFDWPCSGVSFLIEGTGSVSVVMNGDGADFVVETEAPSSSEPTTPLRFSTTVETTKEYALGNVVSSMGRMRVTLRRATEYTTYGTILQRIRLHGNVTLVKEAEHAPSGTFAKPLRLEFFGDSDTAGYCILGTPWDIGTQGYEDCTQGYATRVAASLGSSDLHVEAISGLGVYQNAFACGSKVMPAYWKQSLQFDATAADTYNFSAWVPDVVVVYLGANDWANMANPPQAGFREKYRAMLDGIISSYHRSQLPTIINVCGGWSTARAAPCNDIQKVSLEVQASLHHKTYFIDVPGSLTTSEDLGCMNHRNVQGQVKLANYLVPRIKALLAPAATVI